MSLKLAFIGTGQIAGWHLNGIVALNEHSRRDDLNAEPLFELVALCDPRPEACASLAQAAEEKLGRRPAVFSDYRGMLEKESLDSAALLVPHHLH